MSDNGITLVFDLDYLSLDEGRNIVEAVSSLPLGEIAEKIKSLGYAVDILGESTLRISRPLRAKAMRRLA